MIVHDGSVDGGSVASATSLTWTHVCGVGATLLRVGVRSTLAAADTVTGVTYNGVAMTKIASRAGDTVNVRCLSLWELANPAVGSHAVVVTGSAAGNVQGASSSFIGGGVENAIGSGQTQAAILAVSAVTVTPLSWVQGVFGSASQMLSAGAGTARRTAQLPPAGGLGLFDSDEPIVPAGFRNVQVSTPAATWLNGAIAAITALPPVPPPTGGSGNLGIDSTTALALKLMGVSPDVTTAFRTYLDGLSIGLTKDLNTSIWHDLSGV